jgi:glyoxylase-like metal-dependent hydrolase (beta-lactamase superfamily II)
MVEILKGIRGIDHSEKQDHSLESWVLDCPQGVIIVDTAMRPESVDKIGEELKSIGKNWNDVKLILITHKHGDHTKNIAKIVEHTHAPVKAHELEAPLIEKVIGVRVEGLPHGTILPYCGGIEVIHIPGHSEGNACYLLLKRKTLIAGDTIFGDDLGNITEPPERYCLDSKLAAKNISVLLEYDFDSLLITHGLDTMIDAKKKIKKLVEKNNR